MCVPFVVVCNASVTAVISILEGAGRLACITRCKQIYIVVRSWGIDLWVGERAPAGTLEFATGSSTEGGELAAGVVWW